MAFCDIFGDSAIIRILDHLAKNSTKDYSLTEIAADCKISYRTLQRVFPILIQKELVRSTRRIGKATMYTLNPQNATLKELCRVMINEERLPEKPNQVAYV
jgi:DNA-binding IscR family transcriptional regulator